MKIGIMQPYFMPYIGYFQLINAVDRYVVYDDVTYIKGGWVNRNNILMNGKKKLFTMSLKGASPNKLFNEIEILDDFKKFKKTLQGCYSKAPFYTDAISLLTKIFSFPNRNLAFFLKNSLQEISGYISIKPEFFLSSEIEKNTTLKGQDKILDICKRMKADTYINAIGGQELYNKYDFQREGITLQFIKTLPIEYKQFENSFIPWLSIIDVLMFNSKAELKEMLNKYELI